MSDRVSEPSSWIESFQQQFDALTPLIINEWQQLDAETLAYTEGNLDLVVDYIATQTEHTRTLVHHQLKELYAVLKQTTASKHAESARETASDSNTDEFRSDSIERTFKALERRAETFLSRFERNLLPEVESDRDRDKLNNSLITAFGVGLVIGMIFGGWGRGRR